MTIEGGYILKPRRILDSQIYKSPPHVREIWDYLLLKANHADDPATGIKRGQVWTCYADIQEALSWKVGWRTERYTKWQCETAMKLLTKATTKATMITTKKTTRGLIVTINNYDYYQDPANYENHSESHQRTTREPQTPDTINKNDNKNAKNERKGSEKKTTTKKFQKPTVLEVAAYCQEKGYSFDPEKFFAYYESNGWRVGKNPMKKWKATCTTWQKNELERRSSSQGTLELSPENQRLAEKDKESDREAAEGARKEKERRKKK